MSCDGNLEEGTTAREETNSVFTKIRKFFQRGSQTQNQEKIRSIEAISKSCNGIKVKAFNFLKKNLGPLLRRWDCILVVACVIAISLDPLFFYIPVISNAKKCLQFDNKLGITAIVLRTVIDLFYIIHIIFHVHTDFLAPCLLAYKNGRLHEGAQATSRKYSWSSFAIGLLAILPLPQMVILIGFPILRSSKPLDMIIWLMSAVLCQYAPRLLYFYFLFKEESRTSSKLEEVNWTKAAFNLFLYMLASHAIGAFWYFLSIERVMVCWQKACEKEKCSHSFFNCDSSLGNLTFIDDYCPIQSPDATRFDFGIFLDALQSHVVEKPWFLEKFFHCFRWGLQNLSGFGQNLKTSTYILENFFAVFIIISGLVLFLFLIGNMQTYLQSKTMRTEEMRLKAQEIEHWATFRKLPVELQQEVKKYQQYKWQATRGVEVENLLNDLPKDLRRRIKCELCLQLLKKVDVFKNMGEAVMINGLLDRVTPAFYVEGNYIVWEGETVDHMLFVVQGKLRTFSSGRTTDNKKDHLGVGDFCGEELLTWAMEDTSFRNLPFSTRTIQALTNVEAFALAADDLKNACIRSNEAARRIQSIWHCSRRKTSQGHAATSIQSDAAARFIQSARRHSSRKTCQGQHGGLQK